MTSLFSSRKLASVLLAGLVSVGSAVAAPPVIEKVVSEGTEPMKVPGFVPVGKAVLLPLTAFDTDGDPVSLSVTSSNPKVFARVRTGNPLLRMTVRHEAGGTDDPAYSGDLIFQLFRDLTPVTAGFIAGFAQAGFYDGTIFHRLADLSGEVAGRPSSFIFQGGDPLGTGVGGPGMTGGNSSTAFKFENEFNALLPFTGRGQLAMANSGYDFSYKATNGSQFFITDGALSYDAQGKQVDGRPRHLDFNHTVFAQLTHGWEVLAKLRTTARGTSDKPAKAVTIASAGVIPNYSVTESSGGTTTVKTYTDGVLVLSAISAGVATITVRAEDGRGGVATQQFQVVAKRDTDNSPPFFAAPLGNFTTPKGKQRNIPFAKQDLEFDFTTVDDELTSNGSSSNPNGASGVIAADMAAVIGNNTYTGPLNLKLSLTQFDMDYRGLIDGPTRGVNPSTGQFTGDDTVLSTIAVGESPLRVEPVVIEGVPGTALLSIPVATWTDSDVRAQASDVTAQINWGDGTPIVSNATITADTSRPRATGFQVNGSHSYPKPGIYVVTTTLSSSKGLRETIRSMAVISRGPLRAVGQTMQVKGRALTNDLVATFSDDAGAGSVDDYTATVDWGDGRVTPGKVRATPNGEFSVLGTHTYSDPETFPISVRVTREPRTGDAALPEAIAWTSATLDFKGAQQHLPPFPQAHLVGELSPVLVDKADPRLGTKVTKTTVGNVGPEAQTYLSYQLNVLNAGNKASGPAKVRFYLSLDKTLNTEGITGVAPADTLLRIGKFTEVQLPMLQPGQRASRPFFFEKSTLGDYRIVLPKGETGSGYTLLAALDYNDPLAEQEPIAHAVAEGPINGVLVNGEFNPAPVLLISEEAGPSRRTTGIFTLRLDKLPAADVEVTLNISDASEGFFTAKPPTNADRSDSPALKLTFTPQNWNQDQAVEVQSKPDTAVDGDSAFSVTTVLASGDALFNYPGPTVSVTNKDALVNIDKLTLATDEKPSSAQHTATFNVRLAKAPTVTKDVKVTLTISDPTEGTFGAADAPAVATRTLTFNQANGLAAQAVTVTALDDADDRTTTPGTATTYTITATVETEDAQFQGAIPHPITVTNKDYTAPQP